MATVMTRAERRERTRGDLVDAAERLFVAQGFHATSVDAVAEEAGYTKGAVYSNFASKEDLFLAVYGRRVDRSLAEVSAAFADGDDPEEALTSLTSEVASRRGRDDGWTAVFFEFWAHVLRNPASRARFAELHERVVEPFVAVTERIAASRGGELADEAPKLASAFYAMNLGLLLERLTRPDVVDEGLAARMVRISFEGAVRDETGLQPQAARGRRSRAANGARRRGA
jgi:AcrR family transcriptional regulator